MSINYSVYNWGPLLFSTNVNENISKELLKNYKKENKYYKKELANTVKEEFEFDKNLFSNLLKPYLTAYLEAAEQWYNKKIAKGLEITHCWINFMKKNEFVPLHDHNTDLSSVLYLEVPEKIDEESIEFLNKFGGPGAIIFKYGENKNLNITTSIIRPKKNDLLIFPSSLIHMVYPFAFEGERISIATNYKLI
jgi:hypothetical protein